MAFIEDFEAWLLIFTIENSNVKQFHTQDLSGCVLLFFLNLTETKAVSFKKSSNVTTNNIISEIQPHFSNY